tara:strand:- start:421 stop:2364 length:1944 start_codon:yes stop_codon:yes gene_type:complete
LADPVEFLRTYGLDDSGKSCFYNPFAAHHLAMIEAIDERSLNGGDKAIAAPRGDGKSTTAVWMTIYILLAARVRSIVIIAATRKHAQKLFKTIKRALTRNELLMSDFPEICDPVRELDGAPQRAAKQHVNGSKTGIVWTQDEIKLPHVDGSPYGGAHVAYYGLDSAIRGGRFEFALIDDPETREVAFSDDQNRKVEDMIDGDVAGLAGPNTAISRVVLTTIQNQRSYSYRVTDRKLKPTFAGDRYGMLSEWPDDRDAWDEYIAIRQRNQSEGDKDGLEALQFYLDNRERLEAGCVVSNPHRFNRRLDANGKAVEVSAIQAFFNRVADWGLSRVMAELQNEPDQEEQEETLGLTAGLVASRVSHLLQNELPTSGCKIAFGLDIGKYFSYWVKVASHGNAIGHVIDYGIIENPNMTQSTAPDAVGVSLMKALDMWRTDMLGENPPDFGLIDSGFQTDTVYEFIRRSGGSPFAAAKGWDTGRFKVGENKTGRRVFHEAYAQFQTEEKIWLYNVHTEWWKQYLQERFLTRNIVDGNFNDGSLSLFNAGRDPKRHLNFSHHITSEGEEKLFVEGKGIVRSWKVYSRNNHWLDATALAMAALGVLGIRLIPRVSLQTVASRAKPEQETKKPDPRYPHRQGGWVQGSKPRKAIR